MNPASEAPTPRLPLARAAAGDEEWASPKTPPLGAQCGEESHLNTSEFVTACSPVTRSAFEAAGLSFTHPHRSGDMSLLQRNLHPKERKQGLPDLFMHLGHSSFTHTSRKVEAADVPARDAWISRVCDCSPGLWLSLHRKDAGWTSKTLAGQNEPVTRGDPVSLHVYEVLRAATFIETEWNVGARAWAGGCGVLFDEYRVSDLQDAESSGDGGDARTTLSLMP